MEAGQHPVHGGDQGCLLRLYTVSDILYDQTATDKADVLPTGEHHALNKHGTNQMMLVRDIGDIGKSRMLTEAVAQPHGPVVCPLLQPVPFP